MCRDQVLTLMLLGQIKAVAKKGMFAAFIDVKKAYNRVDRGKLWECVESMGFGAGVIAFLRAANRSLSGEVKISEAMSEVFGVTRREGYVLSPLLFSLYINSVEKVRVAGVGVECRGQMITALLYADDAVSFAENEEEMSELEGAVRVV